MQIVKLPDIYSDPLPNLHGVPQGSILGPSLYNCYINDIKCVEFNGYLNVYADDMTIVVAANSNEELVLQ